MPYIKLLWPKLVCRKHSFVDTDIYGGGFSVVPDPAKRLQDLRCSLQFIRRPGIINVDIFAKNIFIIGYLADQPVDAF